MNNSANEKKLSLEAIPNKFKTPLRKGEQKF